MHDRFSPQPWISYYSCYDSLNPRPKDNDVLFLGSIICHTYIFFAKAALRLLAGANSGDSISNDERQKNLASVTAEVATRGA